MAVVRLFGLHSSVCNEVIEFYSSREEADRDRARILEDEPTWAAVLSIVAVEYSGGQLRVAVPALTPRS